MGRAAARLHKRARARDWKWKILVNGSRCYNCSRGHILISSKAHRTPNSANPILDPNRGVREREIHKKEKAKNYRWARRTQVGLARPGPIRAHNTGPSITFGLLVTTSNLEAPSRSPETKRVRFDWSRKKLSAGQRATAGTMNTDITASAKPEYPVIDRNPPFTTVVGNFSTLDYFRFVTITGVSVTVGYLSGSLSLPLSVSQFVGVCACVRACVCGWFYSLFNVCICAEVFVVFMKLLLASARKVVMGWILFSASCDDWWNLLWLLLSSCLLDSKGWILFVGGQLPVSC